MANKKKIKLNAVFCLRQLNYCSGGPRASEMFRWGSAPAKRLKTTALGFHIQLISILRMGSLS